MERNQFEGADLIIRSGRLIDGTGGGSDSLRSDGPVGFAGIPLTDHS
jgi:hypothetical protein